MSFPSVMTVLGSEGLTVESATEAQLERAVVEAVKIDLPLGFLELENAAKKLQEGSEGRVIATLDPASETGKQFIRLFAAEPVRKTLEKHFDASLGFYNCCTGIIAQDKESLHLSMREQIEFQDPSRVDC